MVDAIRAARNDKRIAVLVLDLEGLEAAGLAKLQDIAAALADFRRSGKRVLAWGTLFDQRQDDLAAHADEVYIDPFGAVLLEGYAYYRNYYKGTLDKLAVDIHVFKVGTHKSAPESLTRTDMSPEDRGGRGAAGALWHRYKTTWRARGTRAGRDPGLCRRGRRGVREYAGDTAQYAQTRGLVNGLKTRDQFERDVTALVGEDEDSTATTRSTAASTCRSYARRTALHRRPIARSR